MDHDDTNNPVRSIMEENQRLKQRISVLQGHIDRIQKQVTGQPPPDQTQVTQVVGLLKKKDETLDQYGKQIEEKSRALEQTVAKLQQANDRLQTWVAALRLYQDMFEQDEAILLGFSREGRLVLYNQMAGKFWGEAIQTSMLHRDVEEGDFSRIDPGLPTAVRQAIQGNRKVRRQVKRPEGTVTVTVHPIGSATDVRGVLAKVILPRLDS